MAAPTFEDRPLDTLISLHGRRAVVTGGSRGIGLASAVRLAEAGADVFITDSEPDEAGVKAAMARLDGSGGRVLTGQLDVTESVAIPKVFERVIAEFGGLEILVNNAGIFPAAPLLQQSFAAWRQVMAVNLDGTLECCHSAAAYMSGSGRGGVIVNMTSTNGHRAAGPGLTAYTASKHALTGLTKALAVDLGPMGIRVLAVAPTTVNTPGFQEKLPELEAAGLGDVIGTLGSMLPLGRIAEPDDVARAVLFAVSDLAGFMTGSTLFVDGGGMAL